MLTYKKKINIIAQIHENEWNNKKTIQLNIKDLILKSNNSWIKSICFNCINSKLSDYLLSYKNKINIIGQIQENVWNNKKTVQLNIKDIIL